LGETWERCELEVALVRDELLNLIAEKKYGQLTDDDPKLAERAIAELRRNLQATVEEEGERHGALAGRHDALAERLPTGTALVTEMKTEDA
jgi:hypothetical protein